VVADREHVELAPGPHPSLAWQAALRVQQLSEIAQEGWWQLAAPGGQVGDGYIQALEVRMELVSELFEQVELQVDNARKVHQTLLRLDTRR
jgi:hypothetical protein